MLQRDQILQWYTLHKRLQRGQRIVQSGPFLSLSIEEVSSKPANSHIATKSVDRDLLKLGDEYLWGGRHAQAERFFRRCLNYYNMPEPMLRWALSRLYQGDARSAAETLLREIESMLERSGETAEPDAAEWAYVIIALLCMGNTTEASRRAKQFVNVEHVELRRARAVIDFLCDQRSAVAVWMSSPRPSVHVLPETTLDVWLLRLQAMLRACGQTELAERLRHSGPVLAGMLEYRYEGNRLERGAGFGESSRLVTNKAEQRDGRLAPMPCISKRRRRCFVEREIRKAVKHTILFGLRGTRAGYGLHGYHISGHR